MISKKPFFPFVSGENEAQRIIKYIQDISDENTNHPLIFTSLADEKIKALFTAHNITVFDIFSSFIPAMEKHLNTISSHAIGETHGVGSSNEYLQRIEALNFSLSHDDGMKINELDHADIILTGVSRSGKTPTCLYLAMHYNFKAANYPLVETDFGQTLLPSVISNYQDRLFGLTISPQQLCKIREERRPNSKYASYEQCVFEIEHAEKIFNNTRIPYINTSSISIEEIATTIIQRMNLKSQGKW